MKRRFKYIRVLYALREAIALRSVEVYPSGLTIWLARELKSLFDFVLLTKSRTPFRLGLLIFLVCCFVVVFRTKSRAPLRLGLFVFVCGPSRGRRPSFALLGLGAFVFF